MGLEDPYAIHYIICPFDMMLRVRLELTTYALQVRCTTNCATRAFISFSMTLLTLIFKPVTVLTMPALIDTARFLGRALFFDDLE